jgi:hypothetical protein
VSRLLLKEARRRLILPVAGVMLRDTGRPAMAWGRRCKISEVEHEVMVTESELLIGHEFENDATVGRTIADGVAVIASATCWLEVDNSGHLTARQWRDKWDRYEIEDGFILVVTHGEHRMHRLIAGAGPVKKFALFTTFTRLRSVAEPWRDCSGKSLEL